MDRKKEIKNAAYERYKNFDSDFRRSLMNAFEEGVLWADRNPNGETIRKEAERFYNWMQLMKWQTSRYNR